MVSGHDFRVSTYVEEGDWATRAVCCALIGGRLCVVRSHWSTAPSLAEWAAAVGEAACQSPS